MPNQTLQPTYTLSADSYANAIDTGAQLPEADQREILLTIGGRLGGELVELYDISRSLGQSREAAFRGAIAEYNEFIAADV